MPKRKSPEAARIAPPIAPAGSRDSLQQRMIAPVDIASLVFFRIAFGAIVLVEICRFFFNGWVQGDFITPVFHFTYHGFAWLRPWPGWGMYAHFFLLALSAAAILVGLRYRLAAALFCAGFTYVFLLEKSLYLNHFYLICVLSFFMIFVPAHRRLSFDAWRDPKIASDFAPAWALWLLRAQIAIPYVFGGIAKLNPDWLRGQPMQLWMSQMSGVRTVLPVFGEPWLALLFSYGGLLLDLFLVPLLLWKRTRMLAFCAAVAFHLCNAIMFQIGIFPWFMICATTLFFPPDWPRKVWQWFNPERGARHPGRGTRVPGRATLPRSRDVSETAALPTHGSAGASPSRTQTSPFRIPPSQLAIAAVLITLLVVECLAPFRHFLYPGRVDWTDEGQLFAWRMMLNSKTAAVQFVAVDPRTRTTAGIDIHHYLTPRQLDKMSYDPEMIREFAVFLGQQARLGGGPPVEIHVLAYCALNGRKPQLLVDPQVDLSVYPRSLATPAWIMPLTQPLPAKAWDVPPHQWPEQFDLKSPF